MSVHAEAGPRGRVYRVRWREGGRNRQQTFDRRADAELLDADKRRRRQLGGLATEVVDAGRETLDEYVAEAWVPAHMAHLAPRTRSLYTWLYDTYISPELGGYALRELRMDQIGHWQATLDRRGIGREQVRKAFTLLGGILQRAVESGRIQSNPQRQVRKLKARPTIEVRPLAPLTVERVRQAILDGTAKSLKRERDATLVSVLAYAGLRPGEALDLSWGSIQARTIVVFASKTGRRRSVRLLAPLASDLNEWKIRCGRPGDRELVFPSEDGGRWLDEAYKSWARHAFERAAHAAGAEDATPYALRHTFCSLLLHEGRSVIYTARQAGHSPELTMRTYGHVIDELDGQERVDVEQLIREARANVLFASGSRSGERRIATAG